MQIQVDPPGDSDSVDLGIPEVAEARLIGRGGFSKVYAATDRQLARPVAVKVLDQPMNEAGQRRFARECEIMGRLSRHHNVVTVHSAGVTGEGHPYLIMDLLDGGSLEERLRRSGPVPWTEALRCVIPVAEAVEAAHRSGILHRDIKPGNILLDEHGTPHLTDFGIATRPRIPTDTTSGVVASWKHSPPETMDDRRDERSDVYSLASTLYHLIVGHPPFAGDDQPTFTVMMRRINGGPPPEIPPAVCPPALNRFFARALAAEPDHRPQTMAEVIGELGAVARRGHDPTATGVVPRSGRPRFMSRLTGTPTLVGLGVAAALVAALITLGRVNRAGPPTVDDGDGVGTDQTDGTTGTDQTDGTTRDGNGNGDRDGNGVDGTAGPGSLASPYPLGQNVEVFYDDGGIERRWNVQVIEPVRATGDQARSGGEAGAAARIRVRYTDGTEPGPLSQLHFSVIDGSGTRHPPDPGRCGSETGHLDLQLALAPGEAGEGLVCWAAPASQVANLVLAVEAEPAQGVAYLALD